MAPVGFACYSTDKTLRLMISHTHQALFHFLSPCQRTTLRPFPQPEKYTFQHTFTHIYTHTQNLATPNSQHSSPHLTTFLKVHLEAPRVST